MTLSRKIADALDRPGPLAGPVAVEHEGSALELDVREAGPVGLAANSLTFRASRRDGWTPDSLRDWGQHLAGRLSYLMEPVRIVEVDREATEVRLRSTPPTSRNGARSYYEVALRADGSLQLHRWRFDEASRRREIVPCLFTLEVIERLADDLPPAAI